MCLKKIVVLDPNVPLSSENNLLAGPARRSYSQESWGRLQATRSRINCGTKKKLNHAASRTF